MIKKVYLFLFIALIIYYFNCFDTKENFDNLQKKESYELLDFPFCNEYFKIQYSNNINYIINNQKTIYQDINKPWEQYAEIGNKPQNLYQISWKKSLLTFNKKPIQLELHFAHFNPENSKKTRLVFPLIVNNNIIENFTDTNINIDKLENNNLLNLLIKNEFDIPKYVSGKINVGKILDIKLCESAKLILEHEKFFFAESPDEELFLIAKPQLFNTKIGTAIMNNLDEPDYELIKPIKIEKNII